MVEKFSLEDLVIKVMPGGFLLLILFFIFVDKINFGFNENLDFLYTFLFFCSAFIAGEVLQTIAHEIEWVIDIFFKLRRPSEVFLYSCNPVIKNENKRNELVKDIKLEEAVLRPFNQKYSDLSFWWWKKDKNNDDMSQSIFWKLYSHVSETDEIKTANRNYLFVRVISLEFFIIAVILLVNKYFYYSILSSLLFVIFLWRGRGLARGLVFKTVLLSLKKI
ncbi:MAG: hypothetical protein WC725_01890 [Patescibacteria group bacterium]|jgi:hypothetical protein